MNQVITRRAKKELHTSDLKVGQQPPIILDDNPIDHENVILPVGNHLQPSYLASLAFAEEPVTIRIERSAEKFSPMVVDAWVNGKGAEAFINGKWIECGFLPVGIPVITKRKYVEVLARSKVDTVNTNVVKHENHEDNIIDRTTHSKVPFTIIKDANPVGTEWLTKLFLEG
jgi:hypothetical protein